MILSTKLLSKSPNNSVFVSKQSNSSYSRSNVGYTRLQKNKLSVQALAEKRKDSLCMDSSGGSTATKSRVPLTARPAGPLIQSISTRNDIKKNGLRCRHGIKYLPNNKELALCTTSAINHPLYAVVQSAILPFDGRRHFTYKHAAITTCLRRVK